LCGNLNKIDALFFGHSQCFFQIKDTVGSIVANEPYLRSSNSVIDFVFRFFLLAGNETRTE